MDEKETTERLKYFQGIAAKYGYQTIPASTVYHAFEEMTQPAKLGFATIKTGLYGKVVNADLVHLMKLQALKGAGYSVWWGVSLPYMPHEWRTSLRWHRTFKSSRLDLFETPHDYFPAIMADWREGEKYVADTLHGELYLQETLQLMWKRLHHEITTWFSSVQSLDSILQKAHEQVERKWTGPHHQPDPLMVYAFTLGRIGHTEEAMMALSSFFELDLEPLETQENLEKALERIHAG